MVDLLADLAACPYALGALARVEWYYAIGDAADHGSEQRRAAYALAAEAQRVWDNGRDAADRARTARQERNALDEAGFARQRKIQRIERDSATHRAGVARP